MKVFIVLVFAAVLTVSCRKNNGSCGDQIAGKWELRETAGGIAGTIQYKPGNGTVYLFDDNKGYKFISQGAVVTSGTYEITRSGSDWLLQLHYIFNGQPQSENDSIRLNRNTLIFLPAETCCDMPTVSYEKLQ